jgi:hypothetical protein
MSVKSEVLFFPSIEFYDDAWLKGALCHWDKIYRIVPPSYAPNDSDDVKRAVDAGLVESINFTRSDLQLTAHRFTEFFENTYLTPAGLDGYEEQYSRLHHEKVDARIREQLAALAKHVDQDGFLTLSRRVTNSYMLYLAEEVSRSRNIPKITDDADMFAAMGYFEHDGNFNEAIYNEDAEEVTATLALASLVPSNVDTYSMEQVIEFHQRNIEGRTAYRESVHQLVQELKSIQNKEFFLKRIEKFEQDLDISRRKFYPLKDQMIDYGCGLVAVGLPMAYSAFSVLSNAIDPWSFTVIGKCAALGAVSALADHAKSRRSKWTPKDASYWYSMQRTFGSTGFTGTIPNFHRKFEEFIND